MIERVVFHRLITDFEEKALRVDNSAEKRRARLYQMKLGVEVVVNQRKS